MAEVSVALMVKNEEQLLPNCLASVISLADELIVVDTGSTDGTIQIAESFGAQVYHHPWENDFSLHRNQCISYVTKPWMLLIDADEELKYNPGATPDLLRKFLDTVPDDVVNIIIRMYDIKNGSPMMVCNSLRFFRKDTIQYENRVHNMPKFSGNTIIMNEVFLYHFGYNLATEKMEAKYQRTYNLLLKTLEDVPFNPQNYFYLCQMCGQHGDVEESLEWGEKYINSKDQIGPAFNHTIYFSMINQYHEFKNIKRAKELIAMGLSASPSDPDLLVAAADHAALTKDASMMINTTREYMQRYLTMMQNPSAMGHKFYFTLRDDIFGLQVYRFFMSCLQEAVGSMDWLLDFLPVSDRVYEELSSNLKSIGLYDQLFPKAEHGKTYIYITGYKHSGKTLLLNMFNAFQNTLVIGEKVSLFKMFKMQTDKKIIVGECVNTFPLTGFPERKHDEILKQVIKDNKVILLNVIRDGRDFITETDYTTPDVWMRSVLQAQKFAPVIKLNIKYEELVQDPDTIQQQIVNITKHIRKTKYPNWSTYPKFIKNSDLKELKYEQNQDRNIYKARFPGIKEQFEECLKYLEYQID